MGTQKWIMEKSEVTGAGHLREEGEIKVEGEIEEQQGPDEVYDDMGNKIDVKKAKPMEAKEIKKAIKDVEKKLKDHRRKTISAKSMGGNCRTSLQNSRAPWRANPKNEERSSVHTCINQYLSRIDTIFAVLHAMRGHWLTHFEYEACLHVCTLTHFK